MEKVTSVEQGVDKILAIYEKSATQKWRIIKDDNLVEHVEIDGKTYPFFWWHEDPQTSALRNNAASCKAVSCKFNALNCRSEGIDKLMYKEFEIADWVLGSTVSRLTCFEAGTSVNVLATYENERVVLFELGSTLPDGTVQQGRHSVWGEQGMGSDRVVSQKLASSAIYMFTDSPNPTEFNDEVIHLYGLEKTDVNRVACVYKMLTGEVDYSDWNERDARVRKYIRLAHKSAQEGRCVHFAEEE